MPWRVASVLFLTISVVSAGFFVEENLKMRDCRVEVLDFRVEPAKAVLKLKITNPTLFPLNVRKIEIHRIQGIESRTLGCFTGRIIIQPSSSAEVFIPVNVQGLGSAARYEIGGTAYVTGIFGDATIPFSLGLSFSKLRVEWRSCEVIAVRN